MAIGVNLTGIDSLKNAIQKLDEKVAKEVSNEINASSLKIQSDAKKLVPVDMGYLRNSIVLDGELGGLTYSVEARMRYAAYVEFGTGGKVSIPSGYEEYAALFKGTRKVVGMRSQPYLIPSFEMEKPKLIKRINEMLNAKS
jgi:HK97 gp10 family phage protein